jgi:hypothetical protein
MQTATSRSSEAEERRRSGHREGQRRGGGGDRQHVDVLEEGGREAID